MEYIISILIGYIIGSIPTAFIVLKFHSGKDIREIGSGNVGTLNSFEVTNSKLIGIIVLVVDVIKGVLSVLIIKHLFGDQFIFSVISLISAVFGHCYSIWLKFSGGRGLATAAGGAIVLSPLITVFWLIFWFLIKKWKKDIHLANVAATLGIILVLIPFSGFLNSYSLPPATSNFIFSFYLSLLMIIILTKHVKPIYKIMRKNK